MRIHKDVISGIVILLFCAVGALSTSQLPPPSAEEWAGPSTLPYITLGATALCGVLLVITGIARRNADKASRSFNLDPKVLAFYVFWVCYMAAMVWLGDLISGMNRLGMPHNGGFIVATLLFLLVALPCSAGASPWKSSASPWEPPGFSCWPSAAFFKFSCPNRRPA